MQRHVQYCPVSFAAELVGDRWNLLIIASGAPEDTAGNEPEGNERPSRVVEVSG